MPPFLQQSSHSKKSSNSQFFVCLLLLAFRYSHCLQTAWCQLQSLEVTRSNSK